MSKRNLFHFTHHTFFEGKGLFSIVSSNIIRIFVPEIQSTRLINH